MNSKDLLLHFPNGYICNKRDNVHFIRFQFIEKFHEVKEATRTNSKPLNGTTPTTSASASPVAARSAATVGSGAVVSATDNQVKLLNAVEIKC